MTRPADTSGGHQSLAGRVGSGRVGSGRVGSGWVGSSRVGSGQEVFEISRDGSGLVGRFQISRVGTGYPDST